MKSTFLITTAIPYVNAKPHVGHALEFVQADVIRRHMAHLHGEDNVALLSGSDENAIKNVQAAEKEGRALQDFIDEHAKEFSQLAEMLHVPFRFFQRGSNPQHHKASQLLWEACKKNIDPTTGESDIYKKSYTGMYCVGCELFYEAEELNEKGECFEHPGKPLEKVTEENYFFRLSRYQEQLIELISSDSLLVTPSKRKNEVLSFLSSGLKDISISRSNERAKNWGVAVPDDPTQRMYVWFDALNIYQSGVGYGSDDKSYQTWWPADLHVIGKGILRFHAVYWPAFLLSAGLPLPKALFVHDYFTVNGQKMSKTLGNVIDPVSVIQSYGTYGADVFRFYVLKYVSPFQDGDFSESKLRDAYHADLANGLGNLTSRLSTLAYRIGLTPPSGRREDISQWYTHTIAPLVGSYAFHTAMERIWEQIRAIDARMSAEKPWEMTSEQQREFLIDCIYTSTSHVPFIQVVYSLFPFMPAVSERLVEIFINDTITPPDALFPRIRTQI